MNEAPFQEWATRLLEDQVARLGELSNANPRDGGFKLWRQTTLTVIQRLWPGNLPKSERFRRIQFTAPGAKPSREQVREFYDRGCQEATDYLQALTLEVENGALGHVEDGPQPSPASDSRPLLEVDVETSNLAPIVLQPTPAPEADDAGTLEDDWEETEEAEEAPVNPTPLVIPTASSVPSSPAPESAAAPRASGGPRLLKEMLGFMDEPAAARPRPAATVPAPVGPTRDWPEDDVDEVAPAVARPRETARPAPEPLKSATGNALLALAGEVAALGVPEGQRATARAALVDLAHQFDERTATWDSLRHIFGVVMDHPDLARRVVPMLVPYLDLL